VYLSEGKYKCPCFKGNNTNYLTPDKVKVDLYKSGFMNAYSDWTSHGKIEPYNIVDGFQTMVEDLIMPQEEEMSEPPNSTAK